jgi:uncharacterized iron-regulated protein
MGACASQHPAFRPTSPLEFELQKNLIIELSTGEALSVDQAAERIKHVRHIYVGERHGAKDYHQVQLNVLKALRRHQVDLAIGIEWLPTGAQQALDDWIAGKIDDATFVHRSKWRKVWGHAFRHYAAIFKWARKHKIPMWALNAPRGLAKMVRIHGKEKLPAKWKKHVTPLDSGNEAHKAFVKKMFSHLKQAHPKHFHHSTDGKGFERYYLAQLVWDEAMSHNLARHLKSPEGRGKTAVVFAGVGHIAHGHGVPLRARELLDEPFKIVLPVPPGSMGKRHHWLKKKGYPNKRGDLLWEPPGKGTQMAVLD